MVFTTKIRAYRSQCGMTQGDLAARVGVRRETIVNLENGRYNPSLKLAMDIAAVFSCTVEDLFAFAGEEHK
ncbi:MAG TPA: helix-turn-helix transcriptional regulator [Clostridiales bacterium]|nr:helix-turn-helix transcriptional regulator [Clostridiales bacterium]